MYTLSLCINLTVCLFFGFCQGVVGPHELKDVHPTRKLWNVMDCDDGSEGGEVHEWNRVVPCMQRIIQDGGVEEVAVHPL